MMMETQTKTCTRCGRDYQTTEFYSHREYIKGKLVDDWCKTCVKAYAVTKEALKSYCIENHRAFSENGWEQAEKYVRTKYKKTSMPSDAAVLQATINKYFGVMNNRGIYRYLDDSAALETGDENRFEGKEKPHKIYSEKWGGEYSKEEIIWMDVFLEDCLNTYELNPIDIRETKKLIKLDILIEREMQAINKGAKRTANLKALSDQRIKIADGLQMNKKQRTLLDGSDGKNSFTQKLDELEQRGLIKRGMDIPADELERLLKCNNHMLYDMFYSESYDDGKYRTLLGSGSEI